MANASKLGGQLFKIGLAPGSVPKALAFRYSESHRALSTQVFTPVPIASVSPLLGV
ncbi:hypothetical protein GFS31_13700 [Leptolyngbya sp. BL0902]|nr:hypothetical protein GFS31_13700 [Leptolyngbya sp. BL0902]